MLNINSHDRYISAPAAGIDLVTCSFTTFLNFTNQVYIYILDKPLILSRVIDTV